MRKSVINEENAQELETFISLPSILSQSPRLAFISPGRSSMYEISSNVRYRQSAHMRRSLHETLAETNYG